MRAFDTRGSSTSRSLSAVALAFAAVAALCSAAQAKPKFVTFNFPGGDIYPTSINAKGAVAGYAIDNTAHGFIRQPDGTFDFFDVPGALSPGTKAYSINKKGEVTGVYYLTNKHGAKIPHAFLRKPNGTIKTFGVHGDSGGDIPRTVNSAGTVIGMYYHGRTPHGFIRDSHGQLTAFDDSCGQAFVSAGNDFNAATGSGCGRGFVRNPDGTFSIFNAGPDNVPLAISNEGSVTGTISNESMPEGFLRTVDGTITVFTAANANAEPSSINADETITGTFGDSNFVSHGFVRAVDGTITPFDAPGAGTNPSTGTYPASINDKGAIAGFYVDNADHFIGFVRTP